MKANSLNLLRSLNCAFCILCLSTEKFTSVTCSSEGLCPQTWTFSKYSGTCIMHFSNRSNQLQASSVCATSNSMLLHILSEEMNSFVYDFLKKNNVKAKVWIGLTYKAGGYRWPGSTDTPTYLPWYNGGPQNNECVLTNLKNSTPAKAWFDIRCDIPADFICERTIDTKCPFGWIWSNSSWSCIKLFLKNETWPKARDACEDHDADLLLILNEQMNIFLGNVLKGYEHSYWIGLNDRKVEGEFRWKEAEREKAKYMKWVPGDNMNEDDKNCVQIKNPLLGWTPQNCEHHHKFICEKWTGCPKSTYGRYCTQKCSENCKGPENICNFKNGKCENGCEDGFEGDRCIPGQGSDRSPEGETITEQPEIDTNITQSYEDQRHEIDTNITQPNETKPPAKDSNITHSYEGAESLNETQNVNEFKGHSMVKAYFASTLFALMVIGFFMILQCKRKGEPKGETDQPDKLKETNICERKNVEGECFEGNDIEILYYEIDHPIPRPEDEAMV